MDGRVQIQDTWFDECVTRLYSAASLAKGPDAELLKNAVVALMASSDSATRRSVLGIIDALLREMPGSGAMPLEAACELRVMLYGLARGGGIYEPVASH